MNPSTSLTIPSRLWETLRAHLFPGDEDEHGAILACGVAISGNRVRLLARELFPAKDGVDYVKGVRGYRMLTANFVRDHALFCRDEKLAYLAIHNHDGTDHVSFSTTDLDSHERGYPALQDITRKQIVGALVFAKNAVAGDIWHADGTRTTLDFARILGPSIADMFPSPRPRPLGTSELYDRQSRIFGDRGQELLKRCTIGVIGAGGAGSLIVEYLARLGVGCLRVVDPDHIEISNFPRVVGSTMADVKAARAKVEIARRVARTANPSIRFEAIYGSFLDERIARRFVDCDCIFLAADPMRTRLLFNAIIHQYLIPGYQVGAKVPIEVASGLVGRPYSVVRPISPESGCLWCSGFIVPSKLQEEALSPEEKKAQQYVQDKEVVAPSVITLNAMATSYAVNDFLFRFTGLRENKNADEYVYFEPKSGNVRSEVPRRDTDCPECGVGLSSRLALGDGRSLPTLG
jgi:molybdopterin/thiamine biosynthesis adenylyltransferase